jgi:hypothetical protein
MWVAVGTGTNSIAYSNDGINWTGVINSATLLFTVGYAVAWGGNIWVATGNSGYNAYSYDGINWLQSGITGVTSPIYALGWNGNVWLIAGGNSGTYIYYSYDGINWTIVNSNSNNNFFNI